MWCASRRRCHYAMAYAKSFLFGRACLRKQEAVVFMWVPAHVCVSRLAGGERKGGTSSQEHHSWSAATTTQSAASSAGQ